tara:strand:+ start:4896 stop:6449 length:1554 start_codon:yes stop_codon:yes gene_type:complete
MSVQVSYKKQTLLGLIGLLILFLTVELIANVWWTTQINCEFENNEIFQEMDNEKKRQLCVDLYEIKISEMELVPNQESQSITINSLGFRGDEFSAEKSDSTYRIFMLGGSTMFGHGSTSDQTTIPGYLQEFFQNNYEENNIEIINSGIQGADSFDELNLIKTRLLDYSPNVIVIYDGWNDLRENNSANTVYNNWNSMCELGMENEIDVMVVLQPVAGFGNKPLTEQETEFAKNGKDYGNNLLINSYKIYEEYTKNLEKLDTCTISLNLRDVFDNESSPIYWDQGHISDKGNSLIAKSLQEKLIQLLPNNLPKLVQSKEIKELNGYEDQMQLRYLFSNYKTPVMINSIFSFEKNVQNVVDETTKIAIDKPKIMIFETQSKIYNDDEISIKIEIVKNNLQMKTLQITTLNHTNDSDIPNVTYFLKILKNDDIILSDFFYVQGEIFVLDVETNNFEEIEIHGQRQYAHNAIIAEKDNPIKISGPILQNGEKYEFVFELRTIYDPSNWVFSLDGFHTDVTT